MQSVSYMCVAKVGKYPYQGGKMLVLTRRPGEEIMIGDEIVIRVVFIAGDRVRLGIDAPTKVAVHRKEVYEAIMAEKQQTAAVLGNDQTIPSSGPQKRPA